MLLILLVAIVGCAGFPASPPVALAAREQATTIPTLALPSVTLAPTTAAPAPTIFPSATHLPSPAPSRSATLQIQALRVPVILNSFDLNPLPGEGRSPSALALLDGDLYVANRTTRNVGIIHEGRVLKYIALDANPSALVADTQNKRIYASSYETPTLYLIEQDKVVKQVTAGGRINSLALDGDTLYVALDSDAIVERYDAQTLKKRDELKLSQGFGVSALVLDKPRNRLYAGEYGKIVALDLTTFQELHTLVVPYLYSGFAVNPGDGSIWSGAYDDKSSHTYVVGYTPEGQEIARFVVGADLQAAAFDREGRLYVLDRFNNQMHIIRTSQAGLVASIAVNESPSAVVLDDDNNVAYVANQDDDSVSAIDLATLRVTSLIPLANRITALAANAAGSRVYAVNGSNNSLYAIEGERIVGQTQTGNSPVDLALDEIAGRLYVANRSDGTLTVHDSSSLDLIATRYITRFLSTVAVDTTNKKLFAGGVVLEPDQLELQTNFFAQGLTLGSQSSPRFERTNPALKKLYALASNGVPGSNSRLTLFRFDYDNMSESKMLGSKNAGNTTAIVIDPTTNSLYATNTHPLSYRYGLDVFDAQDNLTQSLAQDSHTTALALNPETHHLFLAHANTYQPYAAVTSTLDNTIEILDTRTLGQVAILPLPGEPWRMTSAGDKIYVANYRDGKITILGDAKTVEPPPPTPTRTPTRYPTTAALPSPSALPPVSAVATRAPKNECVNDIPVRFVPFHEAIAALDSADIGCPLALETVSDKFAYQPLERGFMLDDFRDERAKKVYVFFPDGIWRVYADTFQEGDGDKICPDVKVALSRWRPKRGFGSVWCRVLGVQALGPGLAQEHGAEVTLQTFANAQLWYSEQRGVIVLWNDGTWE